MNTLAEVQNSNLCPKTRVLQPPALIPSHMRFCTDAGCPLLQRIYLRSCGATSALQHDQANFANVIKLGLTQNSACTQAQ